MELDNTLIESFSEYFKDVSIMEEVLKYELNEQSQAEHIFGLKEVLSNKTSSNIVIKNEKEFFEIDSTTTLIKIAVLPIGDFAFYKIDKKTNKRSGYGHTARLITLYKELVKLRIIPNKLEYHQQFIRQFGYDKMPFFKRQVDSLLNR